jgi:hypothetical protein
MYPVKPMIKANAIRNYFGDHTSHDDFDELSRQLIFNVLSDSKKYHDPKKIEHSHKESPTALRIIYGVGNNHKGEDSNHVHKALHRQDVLPYILCCVYSHQVLNQEKDVRKQQENRIPVAIFQILFC